MHLAFDIGNTNIKTVITDGRTIIHEWRISTDTKRTGDEYFSILRPLIKDAGITPIRTDDAYVPQAFGMHLGRLVGSEG